MAFRQLILAARVTLAAAMVGCGPKEERHEVPNLFAGLCQRPIQLQEERASLVVDPKIAFARNGDLLVADSREANLRRYDGLGGRLWIAGRRGAGPGEFDRPASLIELPGGDLLAMDAFRGLSRWKADGSGLVSGGRPDLLPLFGILPLDHDSVLIAAQVRATVGANLIHVTEPDSFRVVRSFFRTPGDSLQVALSGFMGHVGVALHGDSVAATSALADSVFVFDRSGTLLRTLPLGLTTFRRPTPPPRSERTGRTYRAWLGSFDRIIGLQWLAGGEFVVQSAFVTDTGPAITTVILDPQGSKLAEIPGSPRMLTALADSILFDDPSQEAPNAVCMVGKEALAALGRVVSAQR